MAKRSSVFEDLFEISTKLPWWVSIILAIVCYFIANHYATTGIAISTGGIADNLIPQLTKILAGRFNSEVHNRLSCNCSHMFRR